MLTSKFNTGSYSCDHKLVSDSSMNKSLTHLYGRGLYKNCCVKWNAGQVFNGAGGGGGGGCMCLYCWTESKAEDFINIDGKLKKTFFFLVMI